MGKDECVFVSIRMTKGMRHMLKVRAAEEDKTLKEILTELVTEWLRKKGEVKV